MPLFSFGPEGRKQFEQFGRVSTLGLELGLSIALGFWGGQWLDRKFGTGGVLTWLGFALGLAAGARSLYRLVRRTQAELQQPTPDADPAPDSDPETSPDDSDPETSPDYDASPHGPSETSPDYDASPYSPETPETPETPKTPSEP